MQKLFLKSRKENFAKLTPLTEEISTQGYLTLSHYFQRTRQEYIAYASITIYDTMLEGKYKDNASDGTPRLGKDFVVVEFDETKVTSENLTFDLEHDFAFLGVNILDNTQAKTFLRDFTTCSENNGVFTLREETTDPQGNVTPAYTINLNL